jgi:hypothetical protein
MKETGVPFMGQFVPKLMDGSKTQTRRLIKGNELDLWRNGDHETKTFIDAFGDSRSIFDLSPYGGPGDRLWVRETWRPTGLLSFAKPDCTFACSRFSYRADDHQLDRDKTIPWRPSIHMPRWASRITLEITEVRVQRIQEISEEDARAEGWDMSNLRFGETYDGTRHAKEWFMRQWQKLYPGSWERNDWVWAYTFRRMK